MGTTEEMPRARDRLEGAPAGPALEARQLSRSYGRRAALRDLTFAAHEGEILGLLGPNGAGKTTAIRILTTILPPSSGAFAVGGVPHTRPGEIRRLIGVLPESSGYPERETGAEFLRYHARLYGQGAAMARTTAARLLGEVGLADRADDAISSYSRGMRQRLGIARALVNDPQVVFLDEPTLGLDPGGQRQVLAMIADIARRRRATVVLSTHLLDEVEQLCDRVLILAGGRVVADGTVDDVRAMASSRRTARVQVAAGSQGAALAALEAAPAVARAAAGLEPGSLLLTLHEGDAAPGASAIRALADAGVEVLSFELERARLSEAFLSVTEETRR